MNQNLITALVALCVQAGQTINLSAQSTDPEIELAFKKVGEKITILSATNIELSGKVTGYELASKTAAQKVITDKIALAVNGLSVTADQVASLTALGNISLSALDGVLSTLKPVTVVEIPGAKAAAVVAGQEAWTFDDFALKAPDELAKMQRTEPDKFQKLLSAKTQAVRATGTVAI